MSDGLAEYGRRQRFGADLFWRGLVWIALAGGIGCAYFFAAHLSLYLVLKPEGVAVFWPAAGITSGVLIAFGPRLRWPVAAGAIGATVAAHMPLPDPLWASMAFGACNAAEPLIAAGLIERYFGRPFSLERLRHVLGLIVAAVVATAVSGIGGAITYRLMVGPSADMLISWWHWLASDGFGIIMVSPIVIGVAAAVREPPPRGELIEGITALVALAAMTGIIISLPSEPWETVVPGALLFPILLWLAARCRPVFAAAGAFLVSLTVVWTTVFGIGHFGDAALQIEDRILQAQAVILVVALVAFILAALFAERKENEARLMRANLMLERERDSKLMNAQAITASIAHEVKQPLAAIVANANAARRFLAKTPPNLDEVRGALDEIVDDGHRAGEVVEGVRALFRRGDQERQHVDVNDIAIGALQSLRAELTAHGIAIRSELGSGLPLVEGHRHQLQQVIFNLVHNALEAMATTKDRNRVLRVRTAVRDGNVVVGVEDSGPGIEAQQLQEIFNAFVTTKSQGMGLGLAISRMIAERHGGQLTASSDGKSGASFDLVLPIGAAEAR